MEKSITVEKLLVFIMNAGSVTKVKRASLKSCPPNELGIYKGKVEIFNPATGLWVPKQFESTFFPKEWDRAKVLSQVKAAKANSVMVTSAKWRGTSPSGVTIEGYGNINTALPVLE